MSLTFDQSHFVRAALWDVVQEAVTAAVLVALMVLVFLGSPRSMLIVITSIPLSILTAIIGLKLTGQTINMMTLGGIALAVGMLVDDATVEVENIHRNHAMGKPLLVAILDGAARSPRRPWSARSSICIVFFPVVLLTGVARFLFTPLALAVVFCDADLVPAVAHAGADDGALSAPRRPTRRTSAAADGAASCAVRRGLRAAQGALSRALAKFIARRELSHWLASPHHPGLDATAAGRRRGFLSQPSTPA